MTTPTTVEIGGIAVTFPFNPYPIQIDYMSNVIKCCQNAENGLLESPTGTGKTLSLLCSSLAWLSAENKKAAIANIKANAKASRPNRDQESASQSDANEAVATAPKYKVIYASRTHKQLAQSMNEMKRTEYQNNLTAICLASRDQYCVNEDVRCLSTLTEKNQSCKEKRQSVENRCSYYRPPNQSQTMADYADIISSLQSVHMNEGVPERGAVIDIEDMVSAGAAKNCCPYYAAQFAASSAADENVSADVVFAPYNYIFNASVRLSLRNAIIIFDEGHNIEKMCEEAGSADISTFTLKQCSTGLSILAEDDDAELTVMRQSYENLQPANLKQMITFADGLSGAITGKVITAQQKYHSRIDTEVCKPPVTWFTGLMLGKLSVPGEQDPETGERSSEILGSQSNLFKELARFFSERKYKLCLDGKNDGTKMFLTAMNALSDFLQKVFPPNCDRTQYQKFIRDNYRMAISKLIPDRRVKQYPRPEGYQLDLFCLNPAVAIAKLVRAGVRSIIITSGTLAPMEPFESELGIEFKQRLSNPHVVQSDQLIVYPIARHAGSALDGSYKAVQNDKDYYHNLGLAICDYIKQIPKGVLIFFKSYANLNQSLQAWRTNRLLAEIETHKRVFEEPRDKRDFNRMLAEYKRHISGGNGAILVAVYRGKISEGLDLADDYCRAVIVVGLPFPNWTDPHVELKREFLDVKQDPRLTKDEWYKNEMLRAVNQAVGRIVRHRNDYGIVLLIDIAYNMYLQGLSAWLRQFIRSPMECKADQFKSFFKKNADRVKAVAAGAPTAGPSTSGIKRTSSGSDASVIRVQEVIVLSDSEDSPVPDQRLDTPPVKKVMWSKPTPLRIDFMPEAPAEKPESSDNMMPVVLSSVPPTSGIQQAGGTGCEASVDEEQFDDAFDEIPFECLRHHVAPTSVQNDQIIEDKVAEPEPGRISSSNNVSEEQGNVTEREAGRDDMRTEAGRSDEGTGAGSGARRGGEGELQYPPAFSSTPDRVSSQQFWNVGEHFKDELDESVRKLLGDYIGVIDEAIGEFRSTSDILTFISRIKSIRSSVSCHSFVPLVISLSKFVKFSSEVDKKVFVERCVVIPKS